MPVISTTWSLGDRLIHATRPEWGVGQVVSALPDTHDGRACQRLTVRFEGAGVKTISTAMADLRPVQGHAGADLDADSHTHDAETLRARLLSLPDQATDPFRSLGARLKATLALYRYTAQGGSLLEWASVQTGLADPLSTFSRHDLEQLFGRYQVVRDAHARKLVREGLKKEPAAVAQAVAEAPPEARAALKRLDAAR